MSKAGCDTYVTDDPPCLLRTPQHRSIAGEFEDEAEGERTPWNFEAGNWYVTRQALMQSRQQPMRIRVCTDMSAN